MEDNIDAQEQDLNRATAYCAWHPRHGLAVFTVCEKPGPALGLIMDSYGLSSSDEEDVERFYYEDESKDWQIVEVEVFVLEKEG